MFHALTAATLEPIGNVQGDTPQAFGVLLHSITAPSKFFLALPGAPQKGQGNGACAVTTYPVLLTKSKTSYPRRLAPNSH